MSPTILRYKSYRFYFFSLEESRMHVHVQSPDGEAKFWLKLAICLSVQRGLASRQLKEIQHVVEEHKDEIIRAWKKHFSRLD